MTAVNMNMHPATHAGLMHDPAPFYDRYAALYAAYRLHVFPDDRQAIATALDLPAARHFAEIGCGPGFYATTFAADYPHLRVTGIDRAAGQLAIARQRAQRLPNITFTAGDVCTLNRWYGKFDRIIAPRLLMVVPERERAVTEMRRALAPGGWLLLAEPLQPPPVSLLALFHRRAGTMPHGGAVPHEHLFTAASFAALVSSQPWAKATIWEANGSRYARCRAAGR